MHRFAIDALADPQTLPRIAGFFAQRAIIPSAMRMRSLPQHLRIEVTVAGLDAAQAAVIAAKLGEMFAVITVELELPSGEHHPGEGRNDENGSYFPCAASTRSRLPLHIFSMSASE